MRATSSIPLLLATLLFVAAPAPAFAGEHADVGVSPSFALFPAHADVVAGLEKHRDHPWVTLHEVGRSGKGATILAAEVTDPGSDVPMDARVITFIFTQQHGNEPAGTPASLALIDAIVAGEPIAKTLANQVLILLPMANPDGAAANGRGNAAGTDINRDHAALGTPEARALHHVLNTWDVHVAMDHHEYSGQGFGNPFPVRVYDYDLTSLFPVHGNVRAPTVEAAKALMYDGIWPASENAGYSANEYGEQTVAGVPVNQLAGGPDPGIERNHLGLHHIAGLLIETRVDAHPNPFHDAARRADIHRVVMDGALEYASANAATFIAAKRASETESITAPATVYSEGERTGPLARAYGAPQNVSDVFVNHGMPPGYATAAGFVYDLGHALQAHGATLVHPSSSRHLVEGVEVAPSIIPESTDAAGHDDAPRSVPFLDMGAVVAAALAGALVMRRRRSRLTE